MCYTFDIYLLTESLVSWFALIWLMFLYTCLCLRSTKSFLFALFYFFAFAIYIDFKLAGIRCVQCVIEIKILRLYCCEFVTCYRCMQYSWVQWRYHRRWCSMRLVSVLFSVRVYCLVCVCVCVHRNNRQWIWACENDREVVSMKGRDEIRNEVSQKEKKTRCEQASVIVCESVSECVWESNELTWIALIQWLWMFLINCPLIQHI